MKKSPLNVPEIVEYIRLNRRNLTSNQMLDHICKEFGVNVSLSHLRCFIHNHGLGGFARKGHYAGKRGSGIFNDIEGDMIAWLCTTMTDIELSEFFKVKLGVTRSKVQIKGFRCNYKIVNGKTGRWGDRKPIPLPKGTIVSPNTLFKKGHVPHNTRKIGDRVETVDGYILIKVNDPDVWEFEHNYVWKQAYGEIPEGYVLYHLDKIRNNNSIENLRLIKKGDLGPVNLMGGLVKGESDLNNAKISIIQIKMKIKEKTNE